MRETVEALFTLVRNSPDVLDEKSLKCLIGAIGDVFPRDELHSFFESRCFALGFAVRLDSGSIAPERSRVNFSKLYALNTSVPSSSDPSLCYVSVGDLLLSIPVTHVPTAEMVGHIHSTLGPVIGRQFILYHMSADGSSGHECVPGQSGSRFVAETLNATRPMPTSPRSTITPHSARIRSQSLDHPRVLCLCCSGPATYPGRGRQSLRESSDVHTYRHSLYRSHSASRPICAGHSAMRQKMTSLYFSAAVVEDPTQVGSTSRWILPTSSASPGIHIPNSSLFVFHAPAEFDLGKLRTVMSPSINDGSPQSTPFARELTPAFEANRATNLMSVIQDLINRRVLSDSAMDTPERLLVLGSGMFQRQRDELRRMYGPLNAHVVSKTVAVSELARQLAPPQLERLLAVADSQGQKERPLLVQLARGQWTELAPKDVRLSAQMLGPTVTGALRKGHVVPLPEHELGSLALNRLKSEFASKLLVNTEWRIKIKLQPWTFPVFIPFVDGNGVAGIELLEMEDCRKGFRVIENRGVVITKWAGLLAHATEKLEVRVDRSASAADVLAGVADALPLRHGLTWMNRLKFDGPTNASLRQDLHWCASEYLSLSMGPQFLLQRRFDDVQVAGDAVQAGKREPAAGQGAAPMLWEVVGSEWNSDANRTVLTQWAGRAEPDEAFSPASRTRRLMAKLTAGAPVTGTVASELEELGIDSNTEYSRFYLPDPPSRDESDAGDSTVQKDAPVQKKRVTIDTALPPVTVTIDTALPPMTVTSDTVVPAVSPRSPRSPVSPPLSPRSAKTPMSPIGRSRRQSLASREPRVLRSSKDTRQFEFHPFDPNLILTGSRGGVISLIDADKDVTLMQTRVDTSPVLGLSWLRAHMNVALYGASSSGLVGMLKLGDTAMDYQPIGRFQNLSSVSINCTDDYFLVSGFSRDVSLFDLVSGKKVSELKEIHSNFINITRFANFSPHLLATSSFDSTCKLWDLRKPPTSCVASYTTPTLNVMCCFSPLDDCLLVSGLDSNVVQLSVKAGLVPNIPPETLAAAIPARNSSSNYRRAVYTADGDAFITAGTDENFMRVIDAATGRSKSVCTFDGLLDAFDARLASNGYRYSPLKQAADMTVGPEEVDPAKTAEYVQSLRGHPIFTQEVGVLLYPFDRSRSSYICTTQIPSI